MLNNSVATVRVTSPIKRVVAGSNPVLYSNMEIAQLAEHLTYSTNLTQDYFSA